MSTTLALGVAIAKIILFAAGGDNLANIVGEGNEVGKRVAQNLRRPKALESVGRKIAEDLDQYISIEYKAADNDINAAIVNVVEILEKALEDPQALVDATIDPGRLTDHLQKNGAEKRRKSLGGKSAQIYSLLLNASIDAISRHAPQSVGFSEAATTRILRLVDDTAETAQRIESKLDTLSTRMPLNPQAVDEIEAYYQEIAYLAPTLLLGRTEEIARLEKYATHGTNTWQGLYANAQSGKTALLSTFTLVPPQGIVVVPFFVLSHQAIANDWHAFLDRVMPHLAHLAGAQTATIDTSPTRARVRFQQLLAQAASECMRKGETLVILIDGLDEDSYYLTRSKTQPSIAGLLPMELPPGVKVLVSIRSNPPLPDDLEKQRSGHRGHPLRDPNNWRELPVSPHARAAFRPEDVHDFMSDIVGLDIAAFLAASDAPLTLANLSALTDCNLPSVNKIINAAHGRLLRPTGAYGDSPFNVGYTIAHALILPMVLTTIDPTLHDTGTPTPDDYLRWDSIRHRTLRPWRERIHQWADVYAAREWPEDTPRYLLETGYLNLLLSDPNSQTRMVDTVTDPLRIERLYMHHEGTYYPAVRQIREAMIGILDKSKNENYEHSLKSIIRLYIAHETIISQLDDIPVNLPVVYAQLDKVHLALNLAQSITPDSRRIACLIELIRVFAENGYDEMAIVAVEAARISANSMERDVTRIEHLKVVAKAAVNYGPVETARSIALEAIEVAKNISDLKRADSVLGDISLIFASGGYAEDAGGAAKSIYDPILRMKSLSMVAKTLAANGNFNESCKLFDTCVDLATYVHGLAKNTVDCSLRAQMLFDLAQTLTDVGEHGRARTAITEARSAARLVSDTALRSEYLAKVAALLVQTKRHEEARYVAKYVLALAVENIPHSLKYLNDMASVLIHVGHPVEAYESVVHLAGDRKQGRVWADLARLFLNAGHIDLAHASTRNALAADGVNYDSADIDDFPENRVEVTVCISRLLVDAGLFDEAHTVALDAVVVAQEVLELARKQYKASKPAVLKWFVDARYMSMHMARAASVLFDAGHFEDAHETAMDAIVAEGSRERGRRLVFSDGDPTGLYELCSVVSQILVKSGTPDDASTGVKEFKEPSLRAHALGEVALRLIDAGLLEDARKVAEEARAATRGLRLRVGSPGDLLSQVRFLSRMGVALAEGGYCDEAYMVASYAINMAGEEKLLSGKMRIDRNMLFRCERLSHLMADLVSVFSKVDHLDDAQNAVQRLTHIVSEVQSTIFGYRSGQFFGSDLIVNAEVQILVNVARSLVCIGREEESYKYVQDAVDIVRSERGRELSLRLVIELATVMIEAGYASKSLSAVPRFVDPALKANALVDVARLLMQHGEFHQAKIVGLRAERVADRISDSIQRASYLASVAKVLLELGASEEASALFVDSCIVARDVSVESETLGVSNSRVRDLVAVAKVLVNAGHLSEARTVALKAHAGVDGFSNEWQKSNVLIAISQVLAAAGDFERSFQIAVEGLDLTECINIPGLQSDVLTDIAQAMIVTGHPMDSCIVVKRINDPQLRAKALMDVARSLVSAGFLEDAFTAVRDICLVSDSINDRNFLADTLIDVAEVVCLSGRRSEMSGVICRALIIFGGDKDWFDHLPPMNWVFE